MTQSVIEIFTDGSCLGNPGPGGYGILLRYGSHYKELSAGFFLTTNNRMELSAAIEALAAIRSRNVPIHLTTDSEYVRLGVTRWMPNWILKNWKRADNKPVLNQDLWLRLQILLQERLVQWFWIRGHSGHVENSRCDCLAQEAARSPMHEDEGYALQRPPKIVKTFKN